MNLVVSENEPQPQRVYLHTPNSQKHEKQISHVFNRKYDIVIFCEHVSHPPKITLFVGYHYYIYYYGHKMQVTTFFGDQHTPYCETT